MQVLGEECSMQKEPFANRPSMLSLALLPQVYGTLESFLTTAVAGSGKESQALVSPRSRCEFQLTTFQLGDLG